MSELSARQMQVLKLIADGLTDAEMVQELGIGIKTVHTHVEGVRVKLGARNRAQAVDLGHKAGYLGGGR